MAKKVLFINQEIVPYVPETEMAIMGKALPERTQNDGFEIRTFMPKWGNINERRGQLHEVIRLSGMNLIINEADHPLIIKVASIPTSRIQVYFIDNEDYFMKRAAMTMDDAGNEYSDNGERAVFFARGVLETVKKLRWTPDVIHCQGWMAAVVPFYVKTAYKDEPSFSNAKVVTSLFTSQIKGELGKDFKKSVAFREATEDLLSSYKDDFNFLELGKLALDYSDAVVHASDHVNESLKAHAALRNIPTLEYPGEDFGAAYSEFYNSICSD